MKVERIPVPNIPQPLAHYTPVVRVGDVVFAAGQIASDYTTGVAPEARVDPAFPYHGSDIQRQARYILENLRRTFEAAGTTLANVVKAQVFLTDLNHFFAFDEVWREFFPTPPPRTTVGTTGLLVPGCLVERSTWWRSPPDAPAGAQARGVAEGDGVKHSWMLSERRERQAWRRRDR